MKLEIRLNKMKSRAWDMICKGNYNDALQIISALAAFYYGINQKYTDDTLEKMMQAVELSIKCKTVKALADTILFYDGFGFETRGLAFIYVRALCEKGYHVVYLVDGKHSKEIPKIRSVLKKYNGEMVSIPYRLDCMMDRAIFIANTAIERNVAHAMLYTTPSDASGVLAFMNMPECITRYQINLTDHAFWLGVHAFDYCIEYRNYGASVSEYYRGIDKSRLYIQPYYPANGYTGEFQGFPFDRRKDDFVVFSGGSLYKTKDEKGIYYKIVRYLLENYPSVKFWYAGHGESRDMEELLKNFRGRAFYTREREDLSLIMQNCDLYLSTYPIAGGLMSQYAAAEGCFPLTLRGTQNGGTLMQNEECKLLVDTPEELLEEFDKLYSDNLYRSRVSNAIRNCVISREAFAGNLDKILQERKSGFLVSTEKIDTSDFLKLYDNGHFEAALQIAIGSPKYPMLFCFMPFYYSISILKKFGWWINNKLYRKVK